MSKFRFSLNNVESRHEGVIESESFIGAVDALGQYVDVRRGDLLEIGVLGFPPAKYECVGEFQAGMPVWVPYNKQAA